MSTAFRQLGAMTMLGVRGASPGEPDLEEDLDACVHADVRMVLLFDRDIAAGGLRNVRSPEQLRTLTDNIRSRLGDDALVAVDQEGGRVQRLSSAHGFPDWPSARDYARLDAEQQIAQARSMGNAMHDAGIDLNFAPCVDVDVNPASPVIGALGRAFSDDPDVVAECARLVVRAHRSAGVACVLKHFPGHGSAAADSHDDLVDISTSWDRARELAPYRVLMDERVGVMTGHLLAAAIDAHRPAALSRAVTSGLLREQMGFYGPVFTDALDMEGARARWSLEETLRLGVEAGADVLVHACNSTRNERAWDVVRAMEQMSEQIEGLEACSDRSRTRVRALTESRDVD